MIEKIRNSAIAIFFATMTVIFALLYPQLRNILSNLEQMTSHSKDTMQEFRELSKEQRAFIKLQEDYMQSASFKRTTGEALVGVRNFGRAMVKFDDILARINKETLPRANDVLFDGSNTLKAATKTTEQAERTIQAAGIDIMNLTNSVDKTLDAATNILDDPAIPEILNNAAGTTAELQKTAQVFNDNLPEFFVSTNKTAANVARFTGYAADVAGDVARPKSFFRKALDIGLGATLSNIRSLR